MKDLVNNIKAVLAFVHQAISTDTTTEGAIIDRQGFGSVSFLLASATLTDGAYAPKIEAGDESDLSDAVEVDADDLIGTIAGASFVAADDDTVRKIGYHGIKRYVRLSVVSTSTSSGGSLGALAVLGDPHIAPVA